MGTVLRRTVLYDGSQYSHSCYSDVYVLYGIRGLDVQRMPYVNGDGKLDNEAGREIGDLEYPVGTGLVVALAAEIAHDARSFFAVTGVMLAIAGFVALLCLAWMAGAERRLFYFAAAPSLILYAFHNWDLIAVALMCAGLLAFHRRRDAWSGALLGLGAATKLFPGLVLPALVLARWRERRRISRGLVVGAIGGFAALNLPFLLANARGWWFPWKFQSTRFPNFDDVWYFVYRHLGEGSGQPFWFKWFPSLTSEASLVLFAVGAVALLVLEASRARVRPYTTAFGLLLIFLLTAKVFSPQYALWLLPFFVLVDVPLAGFVAFAVTEAAVWFTVAWFLTALQYHTGDQGARLSVMEVAVFARAAVLGWLLWYTARAEDVVLEEPRAARVDEYA